MVKRWTRHKTTEALFNNGWWFVAVGGWRFVAFSGWWLTVGGGWWAVVGGWRLAVGGCLFLGAVLKGCPKKKKSS